MMLALIIAAVVVYFVLVGVTFAVVTDDDELDPVVLVVSLFWPIVLPGMLGAHLVDRVKNRATPIPQATALPQKRKS